MSEGKFKSVSQTSKVSIFDSSTKSHQGSEASKSSWKLTGHRLAASSFLCAESDQSFFVRWNADNGSILEKRVSKRYLKKELGDYQFEEEVFRWCAAINVVDDDRIPIHEGRRSISGIR